MSQIDIGKLKPTFKGAYNNSTAYVLDDIVYYNGSSYVAKSSTTGNIPTNGTYWEVVATGSGGIWDSSLSIGSASQKLRVNSGGTGLEFFTEPAVTSDFVKVSTTNISNGVGTINIDNVFTSDYNTYKVFMTGIKGHDSTNGMVQLKFRNGSSTASGSYWVAGKGSYRQSSSNNNATDGQWGGSAVHFGGWNTPDTDTESGNAVYDYDLTIFGINSSNYKQLLYKGFGWEQGNSYVIFFTGGALLNNTGTVNGIQVSRTNGGGFSSDGKIIIYGLKH